MEPPRVCGWVPLCERPRPHTGHPDAAQPGGRRFRRTTPDVAVVQRSGGMVLRVCELRGGVTPQSLRHGGRLSGVPPLVGDPLVRPLAVGALLDDDEVVVAVHGRDVEVGVRRLVGVVEELLVVQPVEQPLDHRHRRGGVVEVEAALPLRPVAGLHVLDHVDPVVGQHREQDPEALAHVGGAMAAVVDHDRRRAVLLHDPAHQATVGLGADVRRDPLLVDERLVLEVDADDLRAGEEPLPHPQRRPARTLACVAADAELEHEHLPVAQVREVPLVVRRVAVHAPLVAAELLGQVGQRHRGVAPGGGFAHVAQHATRSGQPAYAGAASGGHPSRASTKAPGSNGARSSGPSPRPTSFTGTPSSRCTATTIPPLAEPSSLVRAIPVTSTISENTRAWTRPFCPVVASSTSSPSETGACFSITRLTLPSSSISPALFCSRPAVSTITVSTPWSVASWTAWNATLAGSEPSGPRTTSTPTRSPHVASWSTAAARNVSAAPSRTVRSSATRIRASRPTNVVLPVPLTPTTKTTPGFPSAPETCRRRSRSGPSSCSSSSRSTARGPPASLPDTRERGRAGRPPPCRPPAAGCAGCRPAAGSGPRRRRPRAACPRSPPRCPRRGARARADRAARGRSRPGRRPGADAGGPGATPYLPGAPAW